MQHETVVRNNESTVRLVALVDQFTDAALTQKVHGDSTVAAKLAHVGFWDRFAVAVLERWAVRQPSRIDVPSWYDDVLNDSVLAESLALEPRMAARLALEATSAFDARIASLASIEADRFASGTERPETDTGWLLHRYRHRELRLDEIDAALRR